MRAAKGFTLVEMMIVLAIIAILAAVTYPIYTKVTQKSRRADGISLLLDLQKRQNYYYYNHYVFTDVVVDLFSPVMAAPPVSTEGYYTATVVPATTACPLSDCFELRATPVAGKGQVPDGVLELTSTDIKRRDKNNNGNTADAGENDWN
jgi:type IV pilus assembly protein PilE